MQQSTIINRSGLKLVVQAEGESISERLEFIAHGLKGTRREPHIRAFAEAFLANGYRVVTFDATHSIGESEGDLFDVTYDSYVHDLEDVIEWAKQQAWFVGPFALCGHSMGAQSTAWYAEQHPKDVSLLVAMAPVVNYELYSATYTPEELAEFQSKGYRDTASSQQPGVVHRIGWGNHESVQRYDIIPQAGRLTMPVLDVVGSEDQPCPPSHQRKFIDAVGGTVKGLVVVDGLQHSYRNAATDTVDDGLQKVKQIITEWVGTVSQAPGSRASS